MEKPWNEWYDPQMPCTLYYPQTTLKDEFIRWARVNPDKPYIYCQNKCLSYEMVNEQAKKLANALLELGIKKGDRVSITLPNIPEFVISAHAIMKIGAIIVPVNPLYTKRELTYHYNDSGAETIITIDSVAGKILELNESKDIKLKNLIVLGMLPEAPTGVQIFGFKDLIEKASNAEPDIHLSPEDIVILQYTGGTTGVPKGCCLTNANFVAFFTAFLEYSKAFFHPKDLRTLCSVPLYHIYGFNMQINVNLASGGTMILLPEITPDAVLDAIDRYEPTYWPTVPAQIQMLNMHQRLPFSKVSSVKFILSGSAPLPVEAMKRFEEISGSVIIEGFGGSETTNGICVNPKWRRKPGSVGIPFPDNDVRIVDLETGTREMPNGEPGELILKGPLIIKEYWNKPEETANAIRDGWLFTGDIAYLDEDYYLYIVGRKKEMIITSGFNVYPRDIEEVLFTHPKVLDCGVIGVPDSIRGEVVKVFVVVHPGESLTEQEVIDFCRENMAAYKVPKYVDFIDNIPRTNMNKVDRKALKEMEERRNRK